MNNYQPIDFNKIYLCNQNVNLDMIKDLYYKLYNNIFFSTFPYLIYKETKSKQCINKYNSGNCIAIAEFIKKFLKNNYNLNSYLIPASVPETFKVEGTSYLSHVAILVPISEYEFYILDCALYFVTPIYCNLNDNILRHCYLTDVYEYKLKKINYEIKECENLLLDEEYNQKLLDCAICVKCTFDLYPEQNWEYYLNEIKNPDDNIGYLFLQSKKNPFIMQTSYDNNKVKMNNKLTLDLEKNILKIVKYPDNKIIYNGEPKMDNEVIIGLNKYLSEYMV